MLLLLKNISADLTWQPRFTGAAATVHSAVAEPEGLAPGAAPLIVTASIGIDGAVTVLLAGGADGERYRLRIRVQMPGPAPMAAVIEQEAEAVVIDADWTMPDGRPGWLDLIGFAERIGYDELVAASQTGRSGMIDRAYVVARLADAQAEIEANLAARYALPIENVPPLLLTAVADLARPRLYRRQVPDDVAEAAKIQRRTLERIAKGELPLPLPSENLPRPSQDSPPPQGYASARAYPDNLAGY